MRPKGRWTGVRPAEGREGYFEVVWPTHDRSNSKGIKKATHVSPDLWEIFKTLGKYFEEQGQKYYTQEQADELVSEAIELAKANSKISPVTSIGVKSDEFDSLKRRVAALEKLGAPDDKNEGEGKLAQNSLLNEELDSILAKHSPDLIDNTVSVYVAKYPDVDLVVDDSKVFWDAVNYVGRKVGIPKGHHLRGVLCGVISDEIKMHYPKVA